MALLFGLFGSLSAFLGLPTLIPLLGLKGESAQFAIDYLRPLAGLLPFYMIEVGGIACLVGAGDTRTGLKVLATVVVVNVPLAWGLSRGESLFPDLGFLGIAWGTGLAHVIGCLLVLVVVLLVLYLVAGLAFRQNILGYELIAVAAVMALVIVWTRPSRRSTDQLDDETIANRNR